MELSMKIDTTGINHSKRTIALIPARGGSKRLTRKNIRLFDGKPLIAWTIEVAKKSRDIDKIVVSTEDTEIAEISRQYGAEVNIRPAELARDNSPVIDTILYTLDYYEKKNEVFDIVILLEPTKPNRGLKDISTAIGILKYRLSDATSVVSVVRADNYHPSFSMKLTDESLIKTLDNDSNFCIMRHQELADVFFPEGTIYASYIDIRICLADPF